MTLTVHRVAVAATLCVLVLGCGSRSGLSVPVGDAPRDDAGVRRPDEFPCRLDPIACFPIDAPLMINEAPAFKPQIRWTGEHFAVIYGVNLTRMGAGMPPEHRSAHLSGDMELLATHVLDGAASGRLAVNGPEQRLLEVAQDRVLELAIDGAEDWSLPSMHGGSRFPNGAAGPTASGFLLLSGGGPRDMRGLAWARVGATPSAIAWTGFGAGRDHLEPHFAVDDDGYSRTAISSFLEPATAELYAIPRDGAPTLQRSFALDDADGVYGLVRCGAGHVALAATFFPDIRHSLVSLREGGDPTWVRLGSTDGIELARLGESLVVFSSDIDGTGQPAVATIGTSPIGTYTNVAPLATRARVADTAMTATDTGVALAWLEETPSFGDHDLFVQAFVCD